MPWGCILFTDIQSGDRPAGTISLSPTAVSSLCLDRVEDVARHFAKILAHSSFKSAAKFPPKVTRVWDYADQLTGFLEALNSSNPMVNLPCPNTLSFTPDATPIVFLVLLSRPPRSFAGSLAYQGRRKAQHDNALCSCDFF